MCSRCLRSGRHRSVQRVDEAVGTDGQLRRLHQGPRHVRRVHLVRQLSGKLQPKLCRAERTGGLKPVGILLSPLIV